MPNHIFQVVQGWKEKRYHMDLALFRALDSLLCSPFYGLKACKEKSVSDSSVRMVTSKRISKLSQTLWMGASRLAMGLRTLKWFTERSWDYQEAQFYSPNFKEDSRKRIFVLLFILTNRYFQQEPKVYGGFSPELSKFVNLLDQPTLKGKWKKTLLWNCKSIKESTLIFLYMA